MNDKSKSSLRRTVSKSELFIALLSLIPLFAFFLSFDSPHTERFLTKARWPALFVYIAIWLVYGALKHLGTLRAVSKFREPPDSTPDPTIGPSPDEPVPAPTQPIDPLLPLENAAALPNEKQEHTVNCENTRPTEL